MHAYAPALYKTSAVLGSHDLLLALPRISDMCNVWRLNGMWVLLLQADYLMYSADDAEGDAEGDAAGQGTQGVPNLVELLASQLMPAV